MGFPRISDCFNVRCLDLWGWGRTELTINTNRRVFLRGLFTAIGLGCFAAGGLWHRQIRMRLIPITNTERSIVSAVVDILIPRDDMPGALDLHIDKLLIQKAEVDRPVGRLIAEACHWLDRQAELRHARDFLDLAPMEKNNLLETMAAAGLGSIVSNGFWWLRNGTMELFYSQPVSWEGLGFAGPPQPLGFLDYAARPKQ